MLEKPIKAKNVKVVSFEDLDKSTVEGQFEDWKRENPESDIYDISYYTAWAPITSRSDGSMFRLYNISIVYSPHKEPSGKEPATVIDVR